MDTRPIGIFDSGVGGLTVASAIREKLPHESLIYFGDTRHAPYGDKSKATILEYSRRITRFLIAKNCKAIVIACNSASAMAYGELKHDFPHIPIFNVIDPAVNWVRDKHFAQVGVIATRATIRSRVYARRLQLQQPEMKIISKATPLLAPLVEEGFTQTEVSKGAIERYLGDPIFKELDALILACTHYPLLQGEIESYLNHQVEVLNSGRLVAETLAAELFRQNLNATEAHQPEAHFYVSEKTKAFSNVAKRFFGKSLILKEQFLPG